MTTLGILGAGRVGTAIARAALQAGYPVRIAGSGSVENIRLLVDVVVPGAHAVAAADAVDGADLVVLAVPLHKYRSLDPAMLDGRPAIDAMNYWEPIDGRLPDFADTTLTSSEVIQEFLSGARIAKTLNHIGYHELETDGLPPGTPGRRALAIASSHDDTTALATELIDRLGYDPVHAGPLETGTAFQPGTTIFNDRLTADALRAELTRFVDTRADGAHKEAATWR